MVEMPYFDPARIAPVGPAATPASRPAQSEAFQRVFAQQLRQAQQVKFSRHAAERLQERGIAFDDRQLDKLTQTVARVADKGGRESLVVMDGVALVVNVPQRTVITCVTADNAAERVFTNIDSAAVIG